MVSFFSRVASRSSQFHEGDIIRSDLFNEDRLLEHAQDLAETHKNTIFATHNNKLLTRLNENAQVLLESNILLSQVSERGEQITPAGSWLIDNYYLMDAQIQTIKFDLSSRYYKELPELSDGSFSGLPRVFEIAWALVAHTDSHIEPKTICQFLSVYQKSSPLLIRELWAIPCQIKLVLIENLRRVADKICQNLQKQKQADSLANTLIIDTNSRNKKNT